MTTTRTNISVPIDLKKRMEDYRGQVNWSAIACKAFEEFLKDDDKEPWENIEQSIIWTKNYDKSK